VDCEIHDRANTGKREEIDYISMRRHVRKHEKQQNRHRSSSDNSGNRVTSADPRVGACAAQTERRR